LSPSVTVSNDELIRASSVLSFSSKPAARGTPANPAI
jgi:hypothetical protein